MTDQTEEPQPQPEDDPPVVASPFPVPTMEELDEVEEDSAPPEEETRDE
jgi:hypothetical protein